MSCLCAYCDTPCATPNPKAAPLDKAQVLLLTSELGILAGALSRGEITHEAYGRKFILILSSLTRALKGELLSQCITIGEDEDG